MTRIWTIAGLALCLLLPTVGSAEQDLLRIASGRKGFTYRTVYARNLEKLMRGYRFIYLPSEGSGQNLDLLADGEANVAFAQADVYAEKLSADPERYADILVVGRIAPECVYIARRKGSGIDGLDALGARAAGAGGARIAVGSASSGMAGTWAFMRRRKPVLEGVGVDHTKGTLALNQLEVGALDAVGWVTDPANADQKMLRALLANDALEMMPIVDPALGEPLPGGIVVYEQRSVELEGGLISKKVDTICTSAMLFTRKDAGERLTDKLADVVSLELDKLAPRKK
jgi:TRAP-type uncharacterized transport system substrate-binding protein